MLTERPMQKPSPCFTLPFTYDLTWFECVLFRVCLSLYGVFLVGPWVFPGTYVGLSFCLLGGAAP